jgi:hypothetical protein
MPLPKPSGGLAGIGLKKKTARKIAKNLNINIPSPDDSA